MELCLLNTSHSLCKSNKAARLDRMKNINRLFESLFQPALYAIKVENFDNNCGSGPACIPSLQSIEWPISKLVTNSINSPSPSSAHSP